MIGTTILHYETLVKLGGGWDFVACAEPVIIALITTQIERGLENLESALEISGIHVASWRGTISERTEQHIQNRRRLLSRR